MRLPGIVVVLLLLALPPLARADETPLADAAARARLAGRVIDVVVAASNASSGARLWAVVADALRRQLPETVIRARFNDAGSGSAAAAAVFAAPAGALSIGFLRPSALAFAQSQGRDDVTVDIGRAQWLLAVDRQSAVAAAHPGLPPGIGALRASPRQLVTAVNDITDIQAIVAYLLDAVTGIPARVVVGFNSAQRLQAMLAGSVDFYTLPLDPSANALLDSGDLVSLFTVFGDRFPRSVDAAVTLRSIAVPGAPASVLDYIEAAQGLGRSFYAGPGVAPDDVAALRAVFLAALADPLFIAAARDAKLPVTVVPAGEVAAMLDTLLLTDPAQKAAVEQAYACGEAMSAGTLAACAFGN